MSIFKPLKITAGSDPLAELAKPKVKARCVGRVSTSKYLTKDGFAFTKTFRVLKRKSELSVDDFCDDISEDLPINFLEVPDGVYSLEIGNFSRDYETGVVDDWDVVLTKVEE